MRNFELHMFTKMQAPTSFPFKFPRTTCWSKQS